MDLTVETWNWIARLVGVVVWTGVPMPTSVRWGVFPLLVNLIWVVMRSPDRDVQGAMLLLFVSLMLWGLTRSMNAVFGRLFKQ
jgi:hypothetical protein